MTATQPHPLDAVPTPDSVRALIRANIAERELLRALLKLSLRAAELSPRPTGAVLVSAPIAGQGGARG